MQTSLSQWYLPDEIIGEAFAAYIADPKAFDLAEYSADHGATADLEVQNEKPHCMISDDLLPCLLDTHVSEELLPMDEEEEKV